MGEIKKLEYSTLDLIYKEGKIVTKPEYRFFEIKATFGSPTRENPDVETTFTFHYQKDPDMGGFLEKGAKYKITIEKIDG